MTAISGNGVSDFVLLTLLWLFLRSHRGILDGVLAAQPDTSSHGGCCAQVPLDDFLLPELRHSSPCRWLLLLPQLCAEPFPVQPIVQAIQGGLCPGAEVPPHHPTCEQAHLADFPRCVCALPAAPADEVIPSKQGKPHHPWTGRKSSHLYNLPEAQWRRRYCHVRRSDIRYSDVRYSGVPQLDWTLRFSSQNKDRWTIRDRNIICCTIYCSTINSKTNFFRNCLLLGQWCCAIGNKESVILIHSKHRVQSDISLTDDCQSTRLTLTLTLVNMTYDNVIESVKGNRWSFWPLVVLWSTVSQCGSFQMSNWSWGHIQQIYHLL